MTEINKKRAYVVTLLLVAFMFGLYFVDNPVILAVVFVALLVFAIGYELFTTSTVSHMTRWIWGGLVISNVPLFSEAFGYPLGPEETGFTLAGFAIIYYWYFVIFRNQGKTNP